MFLLGTNCLFLFHTLRLPAPLSFQLTHCFCPIITLPILIISSSFHYIFVIHSNLLDVYLHLLSSVLSPVSYFPHLFPLPILVTHISTLLYAFLPSVVICFEIHFLDLSVYKHVLCKVLRMW